jgi:hypothetical protein
MELVIKNIIDNDFAVSPKEGQKIFDIINNELSKENTITIDFKGVNAMTTAFLNSAIGQLYSKDEYTSDFLRAKLNVVNITQFQKKQLTMVIDVAKNFFNRKDDFRHVKESLNGDN